MAYGTDPWKQYGYDLDRVDRAIRGIKYLGSFQQQPSTDSTWPVAPHGITPEQIQSLLSPQNFGSPHGLDVLRPVPLPNIPKFPDRPSSPPGPYQDWIAEKANKIERELISIREKLSTQFQSDEIKLEALRVACNSKDADAIRILFGLTLLRHGLPSVLNGPTDFSLDFNSRVCLATINIPDSGRLPVVRKRGKSWDAKFAPVSAAERKRSLEAILYTLSIRAAYLVAKSDSGDWFDTIAVNARQSWSDPATGSEREGVVASLQATKVDLLGLQISQLDPKACFRHLKGISTPSVETISPIRPIFTMDTNDDRVVENRDVVAAMEEEMNLAAMPWEDFEQLVRQLFEWEFGKVGVEVKVTRASRDRGVDAIMFDPDPLRGGKYVLQAKRYTRTVDVAAVRDLYGTVVNEGANRGILVTTATYGPDAYEFAKNKPISLVDGPNLISILRRHGRMFRIDLEEARNLSLDW